MVSDFITFLENILKGTGHKRNMTETEVMVVAVGAGSNAVKKAIRAKKTGVRCAGRMLHPADSVTFLGVMLSAAGRRGTAVDASIGAANRARARLAPKIFRKSALPLHLRIRLWTSLMRSVVLYAMEVMVLTGGALGKLEEWQNRKLRTIMKEPAHINHVTIVQVRRQARVTTIESELRCRRLMWWWRILQPVLEQDPSNTATAATHTCLLGRLPFEHRDIGEDTARQQTLLRDLRQLNTLLPVGQGFSHAMPDRLPWGVLSWFATLRSDGLIKNLPSPLL